VFRAVFPVRPIDHSFFTAHLFIHTHSRTLSTYLTAVEATHIPTTELIEALAAGALFCFFTHSLKFCCGVGWGGVGRWPVCGLSVVGSVVGCVKSVLLFHALLMTFRSYVLFFSLPSSSLCLSLCASALVSQLRTLMCSEQADPHWPR
jgi:hypothetical protein